VEHIDVYLFVQLSFVDAKRNGTECSSLVQKIPMVHVHSRNFFKINQYVTGQDQRNYALHSTVRNGTHPELRCCWTSMKAKHFTAILKFGAVAFVRTAGQIKQW